MDPIKTDFSENISAKLSYGLEEMEKEYPFMSIFSFVSHIETTFVWEKHTVSNYTPFREIQIPFKEIQILFSIYRIILSLALIGFDLWEMTEEFVRPVLFLDFVEKIAYSRSKVHACAEKSIQKVASRFSKERVAYCEVKIYFIQINIILKNLIFIASKLAFLFAFLQPIGTIHRDRQNHQFIDLCREIKKLEWQWSHTIRLPIDR